MDAQMSMKNRHRRRDRENPAWLIADAFRGRFRHDQQLTPC
jgi:hypothetical protein